MSSGEGVRLGRRGRVSRWGPGGRGLGLGPGGSGSGWGLGGVGQVGAPGRGQAEATG